MTGRCATACTREVRATTGSCRPSGADRHPRVDRGGCAVARRCSPPRSARSSRWRRTPTPRAGRSTGASRWRPPKPRCAKSDTRRDRRRGRPSWRRCELVDRLGRAPALSPAAAPLSRTASPPPLQGRPRVPGHVGRACGPSSACASAGARAGVRRAPEFVAPREPRAAGHQRRVAGIPRRVHVAHRHAAVAGADDRRGRPVPPSRPSPPRGPRKGWSSADAPAAPACHPPRARGTRRHAPAATW